MTSDDTTPPLRERWEASRLRERLDQPIERATELTQRTIGSFPVRVWRRFLRRNGFLLAASISYQSLFAIFATLYTAFAAVGLWLGGSQAAIDGLIAVVNSYLPGFIAAGSTPIIFFAAREFFAASTPLIETVPASARRSPAMIDSVVVLPAPFGPTRP